MSSVAVVGLQWGDEGKGKFVDYLAAKADFVVRFQGGHNAGHTLVIGDEVFKLNILPSGVVRQGTVSVVGNGAVLSLYTLIKELSALEARGIMLTPERLYLAENVCLVLSVHQELDSLREGAKGNLTIGTTQRGIGPAYEDKVGRRAIRLMDLAYPETLIEKLDHLATHHNPLRQHLGAEPLNTKAVANHLLEQYAKVKAYQRPVWKDLNEAHTAGKNILFEGGQGILLDIDHGTYPFVTSSNTVPGQASAGSGLGPSGVGCVLGIVKAYTTRVGIGAFPTELNDEEGDYLRDRGHEYGVVTGRDRRCGWFDMTLVKQSCQLSGCHLLAITKLDVLDELAEIKVAVGYKLRGDVIDYLPAHKADQDALEPIYKSFPGWQCSTEGISRLDDLPKNTKTLLDFIENETKTPIAFISTGADRDHTVIVNDPFNFMVYG